MRICPLKQKVGSRSRWSTVAAISLALMVTGCVAASTQEARPGEDRDSGSVRVLSSAQQTEAVSLVKRREEQSRDRQDRLDWYRSRYMGIGLTKLSEVPEKRLEALRKQVKEQNGHVYVVVHPAYYLYFQERSLDVPYRTGDPSQNLVERYLADQAGNDPVEQLMWEQVRIEKEFLEFAAAANHLVLYVVPGDYRRHPSYRFHEASLDEYARYLNEVSARSDSFLFVESQSVTRGFVEPDTLDDMESFLRAVGARRILLGGGFVGRCQEDFYRDLTERISKKRVAIVAEISTVSYSDVNKRIAAGLLGEFGRLQPKTAIRNIRKNTYKRMDTRPRVVSLLQTDPVIGALVLGRGISTAGAVGVGLREFSRL